MNQKTFSIIEQTIVRLEACLEMDKEMTGEERIHIADVLGILSVTYAFGALKREEDGLL